MLGVPSRRLSRHLSPTLNVASNRGTQQGEGEKRSACILLEAHGVVSQAGGWWLSERGGQFRERERERDVPSEDAGGREDSVLLTDRENRPWN